MPGAPALVLRFPADDRSTRELAAAEIDGTGARAIQESDDLEWRVFYGTPEARDRAGDALGRFAAARGIAIAPVEVEDDDWARRSQARLTAVRVGDIIVAPPWDLPAGTGGRPPTVVVIEPSVGFGTGHHASTRLCLLALQQLDVQDKSVIDVGTGSGVLAIAAARLGAARVVGIDTDPEAIGNARENAVRNGVAIDLQVADVAQLGPGRFDLVLANLTAAWLRRLAGSLLALSAGGGSLVLGGLQESERASVLEAFAPRARARRGLEEEGWSALVVTVDPTS